MSRKRHLGHKKAKDAQIDTQSSALETTIQAHVAMTFTPDAPFSFTPEEMIKRAIKNILMEVI